MTEASENDFKVWMTETARHFEWYADSTLPKPGREPRRLIGAMRYAVLGGGKRVRALLAYAAGAVSGASPEALDRAALALELVHAYSLVHDDMPSMDNDTLRRGKPTVHVQYGEATAMLAGDALQTEAFTVLAAVEPPAAAARLCATLARAAGVRGMCGGQALDLAMAALRRATGTGSATAPEEALRPMQTRSAWPFRWSTTFSTARRTRPPSARPPARMRRTTSPPGCRSSGSRVHVRAPESCMTAPMPRLRSSRPIPPSPKARSTVLHRSPTT